MRNCVVLVLGKGLLGVMVLSLLSLQEALGAELVQNNNEYTIEEIVVTARKVQELARDVPISLTGLSSETTNIRNLVQLEDLSIYVPNLRATNGTISPTKYIRGAGTASNVGFEQAVGTFIDDVYVGRSQQARIPYFDLERVEVLRGPQVLVYGNSTIAGAIAVKTKRPGTEFEADVSTAYEFEHDELILRAGVTLPVSERFRVRVAGLSQDIGEGWLTSVNDGQVDKDPRSDNKAVRVTAVGDLPNDLALTLKYERADLEVLGNTIQTIGNVLGNPAIVESVFDTRRVVGQPAPFNIPQDSIEMVSTIYQGELVYEVGAVTITSLTAYSEYEFQQDIDGDMAPLALFNFSQDEEYEQFSQEFRATGSYEDVLDYMVGVYYQKDSLLGVGRTDTNLAAAGLPFPPFARLNTIDQETENWSVFVDFTYHLTQDLRIALGARYMDVSKTVNQSARAADILTGALNPLAETIFLPSPPFPPGVSLYQFGFGEPHSFVGIKRSESHFMPQALIQYDFTPNVVGFAKFVKGAKAGGVDWLYAGLSPDEAQFDSEQAISYEAGIKSRLLGGALNLDVTLFYTKFDDLQVAIFNGVTNFVVGNAAEAKSKGLEVDLVWRATEVLTLNVAVGYLDSEYSSFPNAGCIFEQRAALPPGAVCVQDLSGVETPLSVKWSGTVGVQFEQQMGGFLITGRIDGNFRSKYNSSTNNDPFGDQDSFILLDARLQLAPEDGKWFVALFGKNLTDELYSDQSGEVPLIDGARFAATSRTQQIGLQLGVNF